jgi:hypothetical protein
MRVSARYRDRRASRIRSWIVKRWKACCVGVELIVWPGWSIALAEKIPSPELWRSSAPGR